MLIKFPQILRSPEGEGGSAPLAGGGGDSTAPAPSSPSGTGAAPSSAPSGGTQGGAPTTPTPQPPSTPSEGPGASPLGEDFFDGLDGGLDDDGDYSFGVEPPPAEPVSTDLPPPQPPAQPIAPQPPQEPPAPTGAPQQLEPAAAQGPGPQEALASFPSPAEPGNIAAAISQNSEAIIDHLAQNEFQLSQEELGALEADASQALPRILAKLHVKSQVAALNQLQRIVPAMFQRFATVTQSNRANENKFYSRWPDIKAKEHGALVQRLAQTYRQTNPQASLDQMIEELGPLVMMTAKIQPSARPPNGGAGAPASRVPPASPFVPAVGGPASPQPTPQEDVWAGLGGVYDDSE